MCRRNIYLDSETSRGDFNKMRVEDQLTRNGPPMELDTAIEASDYGHDNNDDVDFKIN